MPFRKLNFFILILASFLSFSLAFAKEQKPSLLSAEDSLAKVLPKIKEMVEKEKTSVSRFKKLREIHPYFEARANLLFDEAKERPPEHLQLIYVKLIYRDILENIKFQKDPSKILVASERSCKETREKMIHNHSGSGTRSLAKEVLRALEVLALICNDPNLAKVPSPGEF